MKFRKFSQRLIFSSSTFGLVLLLSSGLFEQSAKAEMHPAVCSRNLTEQASILTEAQAYFYAGNPPTEQRLNILRRQPSFLRNLRSECPDFAGYIDGLIQVNRDLFAYIDRYW